MPVLLVLAAFWLLSLLLKFSPATEREVSQLRPVFALQVRCWLFLVKMLLGLDALITDGVRTPAEQNAQHQANPKNPAYNPVNPGDHIRGEAGDFNFLKGGKIVLRKSSPASAWAPVVNLARLCGIKWGGHFKSYSEDTVHFYV